MRGINEKFIHDLLDGELQYFLSRVKSRPEKFSLEVRSGYINIYYRGSNLLRIRQKQKGYCFFFDAKYCLNKNDDSFYAKASAFDKLSKEPYIAHFDRMVSEIDTWLEVHPKSEREYQHSLLQANPNIVDIEYQLNYSLPSGKRKSMRLDMLMVLGGKLVIVENKYGNGAIGGNAGLSKHYCDISAVLDDTSLFVQIADSVSNIIAAKKQLGLSNIDAPNLKREETEILFLLAAYNDRSCLVTREVSAMSRKYPAKVLRMGASDYHIDFLNAEDLFENESEGSSR